jgi:hypothetical protein
MTEDKNEGVLEGGELAPSALDDDGHDADDLVGEEVEPDHDLTEEEIERRLK